MADLLSLFADPPRTYRPQPFWFLNRGFDEPELRRQIAEMDEKGVGGVVLHCRHGLLMEYQSEQWLEMLGVCLQELQARGMEAWLYDEDDWPSGTCGGRLTRARPELRMRYLRVQELRMTGGVTWQTTLRPDDNELVCIQAWPYEEVEDTRAQGSFAGQGGTVAPVVKPAGEPVDITGSCTDWRVQWNAPPGKWLVMVFWECPVAEGVTWEGGYYLDTMNPEAVEAFKRACYEPYLRFQEYFGTTIKGIFTDEPGLMIHDGFLGTEAMRTSVADPQRTLPGVILAWSSDFLARFRQLKGYDLRPRLMGLLYDLGPDTTRLRCDYYDALTTWYLQAYHANLSGWAQQHGIEYIGHTLEDPLWGAVRSQGNQMRVLQTFHRPGLDYLGHGVGSRENPFRILAAKCGASVAHVQGKSRVMCEAFGGSGHGHSLADRRLDANFMACLGVNMFIPHAFYFSFQGFRKTDWPPTEFYHAPFWPWYKSFADYLARLSLIQSTGWHVSDAAVVQPIKTVQADLFRGGQTDREPDAQRVFNTVSDLLLRLHHDYDYLDESQLERAQVAGGRLAFPGSRETYPLLILPGCRVLSLAAMRVLRGFFDAGGKVLALGELPAECDSRGGEEEFAALAAHVFGAQKKEEWRHEGATGGVAVARTLLRPNLQQWLAKTVPQLLTPDVVLQTASGEPVEDLICCHRTDGVRHFYLLVNRTKSPLGGVLRLSAQGRMEEWNLETGQVTLRAAGEVVEGRLSFPVELEQAGARLLVLGPGEPQVAPPELAPELVEEIELDRRWRFTPQGPNVLILDRWEFTARDREAEGRYGVGIPGQVNTYRTRFQVAELPKSLRLILDDLEQTIPSHVGFLSRRRNLEILLNGRLAPPLEPADWQDKYFWQVDLTELVRQGDNELEIDMLSLLEPFEHLNEPAYLVGPFSLREGRIAAPTRTVSGPWSDHGYPHFVGIGRHSQTLEVEEDLLADHRVFFDPGEVHDCCRILVNDREVAVRLWPPFEVEITAALRPGKNTLVVEVANSLANLYEKETRASGLSGPGRLRVVR